MTVGQQDSARWLQDRPVAQHTRNNTLSGKWPGLNAQQANQLSNRSIEEVGDDGEDRTKDAALRLMLARN
jgi:hypothetical protein